jgi:Galactose oxidase, central domain
LKENLVTQRRFRSFFALACAVAMLGCTQLKTVPAATLTPAPAPSEDQATLPSTDPGASPSAEASPSPSPSPSPDPAPTVTLTSPLATSDFTATAIDVVFSVALAAGRRVVDARITYDGKVLATFNQNAATYRLDKWNPNQVNSAGGDTSPARFGDHTLAVTVKDDKGQEGKAELKFYKPLRLGAWKEAPAMPNPRAFFMAFSDAAFPPAYMAPWGVATEPLDPMTVANTAYTFNPAGDGSWTVTTLSGTSAPRAAYGAAVHPTAAGMVYMVGGRNGTQDQRTVELFSPLTKHAERSLAALTSERSKPAVAILDDFLYVFGGQRGTAGLNSVERVKLDSSGEPLGTFEAMADCPTKRVGGHAVVVGKEIWLVGGGFKPIEVYDPAKNEWKTLTTAGGAVIGAPEAWTDALMIPVSGRYYFFGGAKEDGQPVNRIHEFEPTSKTWRDLGAMPTITGLADADRPDAALAGCYENGHFYLMGGVTLPEQKLSNKVLKGEAL